MSAGRKGKSRLRRRLSARGPWNRPQSSSSDRPPASTRCIEPVTVRVAPQNVVVGSAGRGRFFAILAFYRKTAVGLLRFGVRVHSLGTVSTRGQDPYNHGSCPLVETVRYHKNSKRSASVDRACHWSFSGDIHVLIRLSSLDATRCFR